ncbi:hypothetical protein CPB85DRAFT_1315853 [Mucidula mucida]|nr:hypothetical protein CPB85DRAFT_1315853 [Mucidula mucida]
MRPLSRVFRTLFDIKAWIGRVVSNAMSPPANPPHNQLLFPQSRTALQNTSPSHVLGCTKDRCMVTGSDLSKQSRITRIEFCKSSKNPYHEFLLFHVAYSLDGTIYPQHHCVVRAERFSNGSDSESIDTLATAPPIARHDSVTPPPADGSPGPSSPFHAVGAASGLPASSTVSLGSTSRASPIQPQLLADAARSTGNLIKVSSRLSSSSSDTPADDCISIFPGGLPSSVKKERPVKSRAVMTLQEDAVLSFERLVCIVGAVHKRVRTYRGPSTQCYWFAMCVWLIICEIFPDRVEFDPDDLKPMGSGERTTNGRDISPLEPNEDAKKLKLECDEVWKTWENEFAHAAGVTAAKDHALAAKDQELLSKDRELLSSHKELLSKDQEILRLKAELAAKKAS